MRILSTSVILAATLATGCSTNASVRGVFGPQGGTLTNDGSTLTIPPGALASETTITMTSASGVAAPEGALQLGTPQTLGPEGQLFVVPVTLAMPFDPSKLGGHSSSEVAIYTAPVGSTIYATLSTSLVDATHVSAQTNHFSVFQPAVLISPSATTGGTTGSGAGSTTGSASGTGVGATGTTGKSTTGGRTSGKTSSGGTDTGGSATGGSSTGGSSSGGSSSSGTTSGGELPDAGEPPDAGPDGGEAPDAGPVPDSGGTAICGSNTDCIGASGCLAIAINSKVNGIEACNNPFLAPIDTVGGFGNRGFVNPPTNPPLPSLNTSIDNWSVEIDLPCCPATTGTLAASAVVNWNAGGAACDGDPKGTGTVDITELDDGGIAGTFTIAVLNGMSGSFALPATLDEGFCDAGQPVLPPTPVDVSDAGSDAGIADCAADVDCLGPDGGTLTGSGAIWLNPSGAADGTWCKGPLDDLSAVASISGPTPTLTVDNNSEFLELQAVLPCCPAGPGTLEASSINLLSNVCGVNGLGNPSPMVSAGTGTVTFTQTDGGLVGSIHLDGTTEADATFSIP